jgi:hypothetical protein
MGALQNEALQKRGVVSILYNLGCSNNDAPPGQVTNKIATKWHFVEDSLPLRYVSTCLLSNRLAGPKGAWGVSKSAGS